MYVSSAGTETRFRPGHVGLHQQQASRRRLRPKLSSVRERAWVRLRRRRQYGRLPQLDGVETGAGRRWLDRTFTQAWSAVWSIQRRLTSPVTLVFYSPADHTLPRNRCQNLRDFWRPLYFVSVAAPAFYEWGTGKPMTFVGGGGGQIKFP